MENEATQDVDTASWTIKKVPVETRKLAIACATKTGETMADWFTRAVRNQANLESGERVLPPLVVPDRTRTLVTLVAPPAPVDMSALAGMLVAVQGMAAAADVRIPKTTARHAVALVTAQLRAARGLPEKAQKQTRPENGQTISQEQEEAKPAAVDPDPPAAPGLPEPAPRKPQAKNGKAVHERLVVPDRTARSVELGAAEPVWRWRGSDEIERKQTP